MEHYSEASGFHVLCERALTVSQVTSALVFYDPLADPVHDFYPASHYGTSLQGSPQTLCSLANQPGKIIRKKRKPNKELLSGYPETASLGKKEGVKFCRVLLISYHSPSSSLRLLRAGFSQVPSPDLPLWLSKHHPAHNTPISQLLCPSFI